MNHSFSIRRLSLVAVVCIALFSGQAQAGIIDTFSAIQGPVADSVEVSGAAYGPSVNFQISPTVSDPIGSERRLTVNQFAQGGYASLTVNGTSGTAKLDSTAGSTSSWIVLYGLTPPGLHYDATAGGTADRFRLTFSNFTPNNFEYVVQAISYSGGGTSGNGYYKPIDSAVIDVPFSEFSNNPDFTNINQISIQIQNKYPVNGGSLEIDQFETSAVPEPGPMILTGLGTLGLLVFWRWRHGGVSKAEGLAI